jgi:hypothetical protein
MPDEAMESPKPRVATHRWPWLILLAILILYATAIIWLRPAPNFGNLQDDALYFALGKALATGQGFMLPSFPGGLTALKCPSLYPWLLSWVWRLDPNFPSNVVPAIGLTVVFGCWLLVAGYLLVKRTLGLSPGWALLVTAFCAFNFFALFLGGSVLSDLPFAALALSAARAADRSLEPDGHWGWMALAGGLASLATGLRTVGVTIVAGIVLIAILRRRYSRAALMCAVGGALALPWILPSFLRTFAPHPPEAAVPLGWKQTIALYSSYLNLWRNSVPDWATQRAVLLKNSLSAVVEPGIFLLFPLANKGALLSVGAGCVVAVGAWTGILYRLRRTGLMAIHGILLFYLAMVLPYPFPPQRFIVLFLPLLFGGLALLASEISQGAINAFRKPAPGSKRVAAVLSGLVLLAVGGLAVVNCAFFVPRMLSSQMAAQRTFLTEERQAFRWIDDHTAPQAVFVAYNDVLLYLYTGRQAIRPIDCSTAGYYNNDPSVPLRDAAHLGDVARYVHANYWVVSTSDFDVELGDDRPILLRRENEMLSALPVVFKSDSGHIRIYDLRCFQTPAAPGCAPRPAAQNR